MMKTVLVDLGVGIVVSIATVIFFVRYQKQKNQVVYHVLRLVPGDDLKEEIVKFIVKKELQAGFIATCVGSLEVACLRLANQSKESNFRGNYEIISLVGTLSGEGVHIHLSIADDQGATLGGHMCGGCIVRTTAEIVIGELKHLVFTRRLDDSTGCRELCIGYVD